MNEQKSVWDTIYSSQGRLWRGITDISWTNVHCGEKVLDLGCGNGKTSEALLELGALVTGIDFSVAVISACIDRFGDKAHFDCGDICELPYADGSFDSVFAFHVLEHLTEPELLEAVSEIKRVLVPNGRVYLKCFAEGDMRSGGKTESFRNGVLYRYFSEEHVCSIFDGFEKDSLDLVIDKTRFGAERKRFQGVFSKSSDF